MRFVLVVYTIIREERKNTFLGQRNDPLIMQFQGPRTERYSMESETRKAKNRKRVQREGEWIKNTGPKFSGNQRPSIESP